MGYRDDIELMLAFQERGDTAAFETLFRRHKDPLYRFLLRLSSNATIAEDVSQHTWLKLVELAGSGGYRRQSGASFQTFLFGIARNRYVDEYVRRHEARLADSIDAVQEALGDLPASGADLIDLLTQRTQRSLINRALAKLPLEQREVIALWMQGFELVDVARITGASWHTIVSRKRYATERLRRSLTALSEDLV